jgi:inner membrane protein
VGHVLAGVAAGVGVTRQPPRWPGLLLFALLALAPDLDLLVGMHSRHSHSIGAALLVGAGAALVPPRLRREALGGGRAAFGLACAAAYASHILLDWLGTDRTAPIGIMALWPWSSAFYQSDLHLFHGISRRYWLPSFWSTNLMAAARELALIGPVTMLVLALRGVVRVPGRRSPSR